LFSVGTSSLVQPAAGLPLLAARRRATVVQVNPNSTSLDSNARFNLVGPAGVIMPALFDAVWN
jgi:NAD-dependent deacetylase